MSRPTLTEITTNPKSRDKGMNVYSLVYNKILKCLQDMLFMTSMFELTNRLHFLLDQVLSGMSISKNVYKKSQ